MSCLQDIKEIGYQVGCGFMVGSPYQTVENLADDLLFIKEFNPQMVGIGPFIPHCDTPFKDFEKGELDTVLKMVSIIRLMIPKVLLPATTALATIDNKGREKGIFENTDIIIPVPVHKTRLKERGFNHAGELAKIIADKNNILYDENVLIRVKNTKPQYTLSYEERKGNIEGAFKVVDKERICGKRLMLVDDIFTTGATVNECAKMLKMAGAEYVSVFELSCSSALKKENKTDV